MPVWERVGLARVGLARILRREQAYALSESSVCCARVAVDP